MIAVSAHALQRYVERIGGTEADAMAVLTGPAVQCAARFGARVVRLRGGRIILAHRAEGVAVITVLPADPLTVRIPWQLMPSCAGGPPPIAFERAFAPRGDR